jgi:hypothetical protein
MSAAGRLAGSDRFHETIGGQLPDPRHLRRGLGNDLSAG